MKYNNFFIALALSVGISTNTSYCAAGAWDAASRYGAKVWNYGPGAALRYGAEQGKSALKYGVKHGTQALKYGGRLLSSIPKTPSYIWNKVSSWSPTTQVSVLGAVVVALLASGYYKKEELKKWFNGTVDSTPEFNQEIESSKGAGEGAGGLAIVTGLQPQPQQPITSIAQMVTAFGSAHSYINFFNRLQGSELNKDRDRFRLVKTEKEALDAIKDMIAQILVENSPSPTEIARWQNQFEYDKERFDVLNKAFIFKYYDEYQDKLRKINIEDRPAKIKELMSAVSNPNSPQRQTLLQDAGLAQGVSVPSVIGHYDGLNWGQDGLRYQALNELFNATQKKLQ